MRKKHTAGVWWEKRFSTRGKIEKDKDGIRSDWLNNEDGIAYGMIIAIFTILSLGVVWISLSPVVDELGSVVVDLNTQDSEVFSDLLVSNIVMCADIWGYIVFTFVFVPFIYVIVRSIRRQAYED